MLERLHLLTTKIDTNRGENGHQKKHIKMATEKTQKMVNKKNIISHLLYNNR